MDMFLPASESLKEDIIVIEDLKIPYEIAELPVVGWGILIKGNDIKNEDQLDMLLAVGYGRVTNGGLLKKIINYYKCSKCCGDPVCPCVIAIPGIVEEPSRDNPCPEGVCYPEWIKTEEYILTKLITS